MQQATDQVQVLLRQVQYMLACILPDAPVPAKSLHSSILLKLQYAGDIGAMPLNLLATVFETCSAQDLLRIETDTRCRP